MQIGSFLINKPMNVIKDIKKILINAIKILLNLINHPLRSKYNFLQKSART